MKLTSCVHLVSMNARILCFLMGSMTVINAQFGGFPFSSPEASPFRKPFPFDFGSLFSSSQKMFSDLPFDIGRKIEEGFKPFEKSQMFSHMEHGEGGMTIIASPDKMLLEKDGTLFECLGTIVPHRPFCYGTLRRFQAHSRHDYCYSESYSQIGNDLCIAHNEQKAVYFSVNNGKYSCSGSDERPALLISIPEYHRMCGKLPGDETFYYYPDLSNPFHVKLPNPELGCEEQRGDVCIFKAKQVPKLF